MKQSLIIFLLSGLLWEVNGQQQINRLLKQELDSLFATDQKYRELMGLANDKTKTDSLSKVYGIGVENLPAFLWTNQSRIDSANLVRVEQIISKYGYPGKTLVGTPTNEAVYYIIQHSPKIKQYIPLIEQAAKKGELPFTKYATMQDRMLKQDNKEQLYGTQVYGFKSVNLQTGQEEWTTLVWPIKDPEQVNDRRRKAGFPDTEEDYAKQFGVEYKIYTLNEVNKMQGK